MKTLNLNVILNQGADFSVILLIPDEDGTPINITGYTFESQMRETTDPDSPVVATFDFAILSPQSDAAKKGKVTWSLSAEDAEAITTSVATANGDCRQLTPYLYDIKMTDTLSKVTRIVQGKILVSPETTQPEVSP